MTLKKLYHYFFYKLYRFYEVDPMLWSARWWSDWKASFSMLVLEIWFLMSFVVYYEVVTKKDFLPDKVMTTAGVIVVIILSLVKYFEFEHQDHWKDYVKEFDKWSKKKNKIGTAIVWLIIFFIIANLIFSFYLMSQINWKQYK